METISKTNEQLHEELEQALDNVSEKLYNLLHYGSYRFERIVRDFETNRFDWAFMIVGKHRIQLQAKSKWDNNKDGTELNIALPKNPVTQELVDAWDRQTIQNDIDYHQRQIDKLKKAKKDLGMTENE